MNADLQSVCLVCACGCVLEASGLERADIWERRGSCRLKTTVEKSSWIKPALRMVTAPLISTPIYAVWEGWRQTPEDSMAVDGAARLRTAWLLPLRHIDAAVLLWANTFSRRAATAQRSGGEADPGDYTFYFISI